MRQAILTSMMIFTLVIGLSQYSIAQIGISSTSTLAGANLGEISLQMSDAGDYQIEVSSADGDIVCTLSDVRSNSVTVCDGLAAGMYSIKITDRNSCEVLKTIEVMSDARDIDLWVTGVQNPQLDPPALQTMLPQTEQLTVVRVSLTSNPY